jgi:hypothetical protein
MLVANPLLGLRGELGRAISRWDRAKQLGKHQRNHRWTFKIMVNLKKPLLLMEKLF